MYLFISCIYRSISQFIYWMGTGSAVAVCADLSRNVTCTPHRCARRVGLSSGRKGDGEMSQAGRRASVRQRSHQDCDARGHGVRRVGPRPGGAALVFLPMVPGEAGRQWLRGDSRFPDPGRCMCPPGRRADPDALRVSVVMAASFHRRGGWRAMQNTG